MEYTVWVDDNYHYMDESERYRHGVFTDPRRAVAACKEIVELSLSESESRETSAKIFAGYSMFGDDPWISCGDPGCQFSAWNYARARCRDLAGEIRPPGPWREYSFATPLDPEQIVERLRSADIDWWTEGALPGGFDFTIRVSDGTDIRITRPPAATASLAIRSSRGSTIHRAVRAGVSGLLAAEHPQARAVRRIECARDCDVLDLSSIGLPKLPPELWTLTHLRKLDLSDNYWLAELPEETVRLKDLEVLILSGNRFASLPAGLGRLDRLARLETSLNCL